MTRPTGEAIRDTGLATIAVIEDPFVRCYLRDLLGRQGYRVLGSNVESALDLLRSGDDPIDLVITNTPSEFEAFADRVPFLYLSAAPDPDLASRFFYCHTLQKPFRPDELLAFVREMTSSL